MSPSMTILRFLTTVLAALTLMGAGPLPNPVPPPGKAVFYGLHLIDTSTEGALNGVRADETARIEMTDDLIAAELRARGYEVITPPAALVADIRNPVSSNGRDSKIAAELGADYAISGQVQKVSNLILSINLYIREAGTGRTLRAGTVDIRGNNDESFQRGARYLLKNIIFRKE